MLQSFIRIHHINYAHLRHYIGWREVCVRDGVHANDVNLATWVQIVTQLLNNYVLGVGGEAIDGTNQVVS